MASFHMYVTSDGSMDLFPENVGGKFSNTLQNPLTLHGDWEVGISSVICKAYDVTQLSAEHGAMSLRVKNLSGNTHKVWNWKTYDEIKALPGVIIAINIDPNIFTIELNIHYRYTIQVKDKTTTEGYEIITEDTSMLYKSDDKSATVVHWGWKPGQANDRILYGYTHTPQQQIEYHTIDDIVTVCNLTLRNVIANNHFDKPIRFSREKLTGSWGVFDYTTVPPMYLPIVFAKDKITFKPIPDLERSEPGLLKNSTSAISYYTLVVSAFAAKQLGLDISKANHDQVRDVYTFTPPSNTEYIAEMKIKATNLDDLHMKHLNEYLKNNHELYWSSITQSFKVKHLTTIDNLVSQRINPLLLEMQNKLDLIKNQAVKCKFTYNKDLAEVTYEQPATDINSCQIHISPRILRILGFETIHEEWITTPKLVGKFKPSMDKFLQTMWIYSSIIMPQICADTLAQVLRVIPVKLNKDESTVAVVYDSPIFCKLSQNHISTIDIVITNSLGDAPVYFDDNDVIIGLTFHKCI